MKIHFLVALALLWVAGCGGTSPRPSESPAARNAAAPTTGESILTSDESKLLSAAGRAESENRFEEAATIWRDVRGGIAARLGDDHWLVANCDQAIAADERLARLAPDEREWIEQLRGLEQRAAACRRGGSLRQALKAVSDAQYLSTRIFGESAALPQRLHLLAGEMAQQLGDWETAKREFESALDIARALYPQPHPNLEMACFRLGIAERQLGQLDRAIERLNEARGMTESLVGRDATFAARTQELAVALHQASRREDALREFALAEQVRAQSLGEAHPLVAESRLGQAVVLIDQAQWEPALAKFNEVRQMFPEGKMPTAILQEVCRHQATALVVQKDFAGAEVLLRQALNSLEQTVGRGDRQYAQIEYRLAMCCGFQKGFDQAEQLLRHALTVQSGMLGRTHDETRKTVQALAAVLQRTGRSVEAQSLLQRHAYASASDPVESTQ